MNPFVGCGSSDIRQVVFSSHLVDDGLPPPPAPQPACSPPAGYQDYLAFYRNFMVRKFMYIKYLLSGSLITEWSGQTLHGMAPGEVFDGAFKHNEGLFVWTVLIQVEPDTIIRALEYTKKIFKEVFFTRDPLLLGEAFGSQLTHGSKLQPKLKAPRLDASFRLSLKLQCDSGSRIIGFYCFPEMRTDVLVPLLKVVTQKTIHTISFFSFESKLIEDANGEMCRVVFDKKLIERHLTLRANGITVDNSRLVVCASVLK